MTDKVNLTASPNSVVMTFTDIEGMVMMTANEAEDLGTKLLKMADASRELPNLD